STVTGHLPIALSDISSATVGNTVYLVGGYDGTVPRREIYATSDGRTFRVAATLPQGLRYAAVTAVGSTVVVAGGQAASGPVSTVSALDTKTGALTRLATLPAPVTEASAFVVG